MVVTVSLVMAVDTCTSGERYCSAITPNARYVCNPLTDEAIKYLCPSGKHCEDGDCVGDSLKCTSQGVEYNPGEEFCPAIGMCNKHLIPLLGTHEWYCTGSDTSIVWYSKFDEDCNVENYIDDCPGDKECRLGDCVDPSCTSNGIEYNPGEEFCPAPGMCNNNRIPYLGKHEWYCTGNDRDKIYWNTFEEDCSVEVQFDNCGNKKACKLGDCVEDIDNDEIPDVDDDEIGDGGCGCWIPIPFSKNCIFPDIFCIINNFVEGIKWVLAIVLGLLAGLLGLSVAIKLIPPKAKGRIWYLIGIFVGLAIIVGIIAFVFFWFVIIALVLLAIIKLAVPVL